MDYTSLIKNLKKDASGHLPVRAALLGDTATQFLAGALRGDAYNKGIDLQLFESGYKQTTQLVSDPDSEFYTFNPEVVIIFNATHSLLHKYNKTASDKRKTLAETTAASVEALCDSIMARLKAKVIMYNYYELDDGVFGSYANSTSNSILYQVRALNMALMKMAVASPAFFLCDLAAIHNLRGREAFFPPALHIHSDMVLSLDILPEVASRTNDIIAALYGKFRKCLVTDLDNTLWGGIVGEDGTEHLHIGTLGIGKAFTQYQHWLLKLKERGIILAVCSKNDPQVALEPFEKHPDMVLSTDDFAVFVANWNNKADNIRHIASQLNIGTDSMVFIDDSPFERNLVRSMLPEVCVPELPEDPAAYVEFLSGLNLFETVSLTAEDSERTEQYKAEAQRNILRQQISSEDDYLRSLSMTSPAEPFNNFNIPRVAQLSQRSNQFNLRTVRYTEDHIAAIANDPAYLTFAFGLKDNYGDNGLIGVVILKIESPNTLFIESWFMSCRVLKRGMEQYTLNTIAEAGLKGGFKWLKGAYIPTVKNAMVKDHYKNLGFSEKDGYWWLDLESFEPLTCYISNPSIPSAS